MLGMTTQIEFSKDQIVGTLSAAAMRRQVSLIVGAQELSFPCVEGLLPEAGKHLGRRVHVFISNGVILELRAEPPRADKA